VIPVVTGVRMTGAAHRADLPLLVLGPRNPSVQTALAALSASGGQTPDNSMVLAGAVLSVIPLLILFIVAGKQLVAGIMQGAVKG
jgi:cellobiose transport system permease protein